MGDGGQHDLGEVVVDESVADFPPGAFPCDDARGLQDPQVLADQRLRHHQCVDELVHAARGLAQFEDYRDADRRRQRAQQITRGIEDFAPRQLLGAWCSVGVGAVVDGSA